MLLSSSKLATLGAVLVSAITEIFVHGLLIIRISTRRRKGWSRSLVTVPCSLERGGHCRKLGKTAKLRSHIAP